MSNVTGVIFRIADPFVWHKGPVIPSFVMFLLIVWTRRIGTNSQADVFFLIRRLDSSPLVPLMSHWTGLSLVYIMACHLFSAKWTSKPMMTPHQSHPKGQTLRKNIVSNQMHWPNCSSRYLLWFCRQFTQGWWVNAPVMFNLWGLQVPPHDDTI